MDEFDDVEQRGIAAWRGAVPPADFAAGVMARHSARRVFVRRAIVAALLVAGLGGALGRGLHLPRGGVLAASERQSAELAGRATIVLEAGTRLQWQVDWRGAARVEQESGNVFYRVEPGGAFDVQTPGGNVHVTGTCFRIEVLPMKKNVLQQAGSAIAGAVVAAAIVVTVYEGHVIAASPNEAPRALAAGETEVLGGKLETRNLVTHELVSVPSLSPSELAALTPEARYLAVLGEAKILRQRVVELESKLTKTNAAALSYKTYDLPQEELERMAERCELRWDVQNVDVARAPQLGDEDAQKLDLSSSEQKAVDDKLAAYNAAMLSELRALYREVTGNSGDDTLSADSMIAEIDDKSLRDDRRRAFQTLARERAGLVTAPADSRGSPAVERLYRLLTAAGDKLERSLAEAIGADRAHALRDLHDGFGQKSRSRTDCP